MIGGPMFQAMVDGSSNYADWLNVLTPELQKRGMLPVFGVGWEDYWKHPPSAAETLDVMGNAFWDAMRDAANNVVHETFNPYVYMDTETTIWARQSDSEVWTEATPGNRAAAGARFKTFLTQLKSDGIIPIIYDIWLHPAATVPNFTASCLELLSGLDPAVMANTVLAAPWPYENPQRTITGASWAANVATITVASGHSLTTGDLVRINSVLPLGYNTTNSAGVVATVTDSTHFTIALTPDPGTYVSGGTITNMHLLAAQATIAAQQGTLGGYTNMLGYGNSITQSNGWSRAALSAKNQAENQDTAQWLYIGDGSIAAWNNT